MRVSEILSTLCLAWLSASGDRDGAMAVARAPDFSTLTLVDISICSAYCTLGSVLQDRAGPAQNHFDIIAAVDVVLFSFRSGISCG